MIKTFLHSVIGDNTIENREHLEKIGKLCIDKECLDPYILSSEMVYYSIPIGSIAFDYDIFVDCRNNPQLFQAVSAMRDNSDYMQWFTNDKCDEWLLCKKENYQDFVKLNVHVNFYKATLSELEAHFQRV